MFLLRKFMFKFIGKCFYRFPKYISDLLKTQIYYHTYKDKDSVTLMRN